MNRKLLLFLFLIFVSNCVWAQGLDDERELHQQILKNLKKDLKEYYYDSNLRGVDLDASVKKASELVVAAKSVEEMDDIIARVLIQFDDSHLGFIPPAKTVSIDYGLTMQLIGEKVFVTSVSDHSDAQAKGIRPGDQIYMLEGFIPTRKDFRLLRYHYEVLAPQLKLMLVVIKPSGSAYKVEIEAKLTQENIFRPSNRELKLQYEREFTERTRQQFFDAIPGLSIWKIPSFEFSDVKVDKMIRRVAGTSALILDLRGNAGGLVYSLEELVNAFFDRDVTIGEFHLRKQQNEMNILKGSGKRAYTGKLIVLIDSESASAAEIFARIVQLEGRGIVLGDLSSGQVMQSRVFPHFYGLDNRIGYAFSITVADLTMRDGRRIEKIGVTPDERILSTPLDLANKRDPVLSRAAELLGFKLTSDEAGKIFATKK